MMKSLITIALLACASALSLTQCPTCCNAAAPAEAKNVAATLPTSCCKKAWKPPVEVEKPDFPHPKKCFCDN